MANDFVVEVVNGDEIMAQLRRSGIALVDALLEIAEAGGEIVLEAAQGNAPGSGEGVVMVSRKDGEFAAEADIGPDDEHWYYRFFESGTTAHEVRPVRKQALRFFGSGGEGVFAEVARPGGVAARPFLRPAIDEKGDAAAKEAGKVVEAVIAGAV